MSDYRPNSNSNRHSNSTSGPRLCSPTVAATRARLLVGCYRKGEAADADIYATALTAILCGYSEEVVNRVTDPRTGVPGKIIFFPSIAEVRHECEVEAQKIFERDEFFAREGAPQQQLAAPDVDRAAVMAKMREQYPEIYDRKRIEEESRRVEAVNALSSEAKLAEWRSPLTVGPHLAEYLRRKPFVGQGGAAEDYGEIR